MRNWPLDVTGGGPASIKGGGESSSNGRMGRSDLTDFERAPVIGCFCRREITEKVDNKWVIRSGRNPTSNLERVHLWRISRPMKSPKRLKQAKVATVYKKGKRTDYKITDSYPKTSDLENSWTILSSNIINFLKTEELLSAIQNSSCETACPFLAWYPLNGWRVTGRFHIPRFSESVWHSGPLQTVKEGTNVRITFTGVGAARRLLKW